MGWIDFSLSNRSSRPGTGIRRPRHAPGFGAGRGHGPGERSFACLLLKGPERPRSPSSPPAIPAITFGDNPVRNRHTQVRPVPLLEAPESPYFSKELRGSKG